MTEMIICGMSMEMEMAKEMDLISKCMGCLYLDYVTFHKVVCEKRGTLNDLQEDCPEWVVDHR